MNPSRRTPISVVIPTYNRAAMIIRAVSSVLSQCREGDEVLVIDDDSEDETQARLGPYTDRIAYIKVPHGGAGKARNIGLRLARNPLVAFLDSDDEWLPGKLDLQRAFLEARPDILYCFTDFKYRRVSGEEERFRIRSWHGDDWAREGLGPGVSFSSVAPLAGGQEDFVVHTGDLYPLQMEKEYVQVGTLLYRREKAGDGVLFAEDLDTREEWEFVGKLAGKGPAAYFDLETEIVYRHDGPQLTKTDEILFREKKENTDFLQARLKILRRVWGADAMFLEKRGSRYRQVVQHVQTRLIRGLLAAGRPKEARQVLIQFPGAPFVFRILSRIPGRWTERLLRVRRRLHKNG